MNTPNSIGFVTCVSGTGYYIHIRISSITVLCDKSREVYTADSGRPAQLSPASYASLKQVLGLPL